MKITPQNTPFFEAIKTAFMFVGLTSNYDANKLCFVLDGNLPLAANLLERAHTAMFAAARHLTERANQRELDLILTVEETMPDTPTEAKTWLVENWELCEQAGGALLLYRGCLVVGLGLNIVKNRGTW